MDLLTRLDYEIKKTWKEDIAADYNGDLLLREDCLKDALYFHLRSRLGDGYFKRNCIRIFTEYRLRNGQRADIAIVRVKRLSDIEDGYYLKEGRVIDPVAIIECKYLYTERLDAFRRDARKVEKLCRRAECSETFFYLAQIQEGPRPADHLSVFPRSKAPSWSEDRLTELVGYWGDDGWAGGVHFEVLPYNGLNQGIHYQKTSR